jgi:hypothetical protein
LFKLLTLLERQLKMMNKLKYLISIFKEYQSRPGEFSLLDTRPMTTVFSSEKAGEEFETLLRYLKAKQGYFTIEELFPLLEVTGQTRAWLHAKIQEKLEVGHVIRSESKDYYEIMQ